MDEILKGANPEVAAPEVTAEPAQDVQVMAEPTETGVKEEAAVPHAEETPKPEKPVQSKEDNAAAAAARRRAELEAKNKHEGTDELLNTLKEYGYVGKTPKEIAQQLKAQREGVSFEEIQRRERDAEEIRKKTLEEAPEVQEARRIIAESQLEKDLQKVREAYPDVKAKTALELGDTFIKLMATGTVDPVTAYEAQMAQNARTKKPVPPSTGSVNSSSSGPIEKEFYTSDELDRLTSKDLDNPKIMEKAMKSLARLGK